MNIEIIYAERNKAKPNEKEKVAQEIMVYKIIYKRLWILLIFLLLMLTLTGCGATVEEGGDAADSADEKKQTLQESDDADLGINGKDFDYVPREGVENICYQPEDASQAFPENRCEAAAELWQQVQEEFKPAALPEEMTQEYNPEGLALLAEKALFTRDWSSLDTILSNIFATSINIASKNLNSCFWWRIRAARSALWISVVTALWKMSWNTWMRWARWI